MLLFEFSAYTTTRAGYFLPIVEMKCYNVMINVNNLFSRYVKNRELTLLILKKPMIGQGNDNNAGGFLDYRFFHEIIIIAKKSKKTISFRC